MNRKLLFVRHSAVGIDANMPSREWRLSENGRSLAQQLAPKSPATPASSPSSRMEPSLTLFLVHYNNFAPFPFWQNTQLPDFFSSPCPISRFAFHDLGYNNGRSAHIG